jgi:hypothetical protein
MDQTNGASEDRINGTRSLAHRVLDTRTYWVSHLTNGGPRKSRVSRKIEEAIASLADGPIWHERPTFYVFRSYATIGHIAWTLRTEARLRDVLVVGSFTHAECRIVGPCQDPLLFDLVPFTAKA